MSNKRVAEPAELKVLILIVFELRKNTTAMQLSLRTYQGSDYELYLLLLMGWSVLGYQIIDFKMHGKRIAFELVCVDYLHESIRDLQAFRNINLEVSFILACEFSTRLYEHFYADPFGCNYFFPLVVQSRLTQNAYLLSSHSSLTGVSFFCIERAG